MGFLHHSWQRRLSILSGKHWSLSFRIRINGSFKGPGDPLFINCPHVIWQWSHCIIRQEMKEKKWRDLASLVSMAYFHI